MYFSVKPRKDCAILFKIAILRLLALMSHEDDCQTIDNNSSIFERLSNI